MTRAKEAWNYFDAALELSAPSSHPLNLTNAEYQGLWKSSIFLCSPPSFFNFAPAQLLPDQANPSSALPHFESLTCQILTRRLELAHDHDEERLLGDRPHLGAHPQSGHQGLVVCKSVLFWKKWKTVKYNLQKAGKWERIRECQANWLGVVDEKTPLFFNHRTKATASKGRVALPNRMNVWTNSKRPSTPPLIFRKLYCKFCIMDMVAFMQGGIGQIVPVSIS